MPIATPAAGAIASEPRSSTRAKSHSEIGSQHRLMISLVCCSRDDAEAPNAAFPELVKQYDVELVKLGFNYKLDWGALADPDAPATGAAGIFKAPSRAAGNTGEQLYHVLPFTGIDVTSRTLVTLVEPGSCFVGTLAELVGA